MWLLLEELFVFALLVATFVYVRSAGAVLRSLIPRPLIAKSGLPLTALLYVAPSTLLGAALYIAHVRGGVIWISIAATYVSWAQDLLYLLGMGYYYLVLRRIRTHPVSFELLIRLQEYAVWPSSDVVRRPSDYLLLRLPFASRWKKTTVLINSVDFDRFLNNDLRLIDEAELGRIAISYPEFCAVPHFSLPLESEEPPKGFEFGKWKQAGPSPSPSRARKSGPELQLPFGLGQLLQRFFEDGPREELSERRLRRIQSAAYRKPPEAADTRYYLVNRALHAELSDELWHTSRRLCQTLPSVMARSWKSFHFQDSMRLRFVALFNTADLIQRLVGSILLCELRDAGLIADGKLAGETFRVPASVLQWSRTLELALTSAEPGRTPFHRILLTPGQSHEEWQRRLSPFGPVLGRAIRFSPSNGHTLGAWGVLGTLRNKIIGHGGMGSHLKLRPLLYLSSLHQFFLATMREIADLDLAILAQTNENAPTFATDQGLGSALGLRDDHVAFARHPHPPGLVSLHPYFRYHEGRLLIINKLTREGVNYIDYNVANILEPSFVTLKTDWEEFIKPATQ